ncbi:MAG: PHP domain-containing protein [Gammaproteobacteria bacterium]|nr:PHP domain-containing protein [Gammaproteobacteria bacterium]
MTEEAQVGVQNEIEIIGAEDQQYTVYDLHCHTLFSDGTLSPTDLVIRAKEKGVHYLALTDHDETSGLDEAQAKADEIKLNLIHGVEVSVSWDNNQTIHIVGLNIDKENEALQQGLAEIRQERVRRAKKIASKLEKAGIPNVWRDVVEQNGFEALTRTHFGRFLLEHNHVKDMKEAFKKWLGRKGRAHVTGHWVPMKDAVEWITQAGGQAVIAHPVRYGMTNRKLEKLVLDFKDAGGIGLEVIGNRYSSAERAAMASLARRFDLLASVGSDFHAPGNPYIELGRNLGLPEHVKPIWHDWHN